MNSIYKVIREFRIIDNNGLIKAIEYCLQNDGKKVFVIYNKSNINNWRDIKNSKISAKVLQFLDNQILDFKNEIEQFVLDKHFDNILYNLIANKSKIESDNIKTKLQKIQLEFVLFESNNSVKDIYDFAMDNNVGSIYTDYTPIREQLNFYTKFKNNIDCNIFSNIKIESIDSRNILKINEVSDKEEFSAATFRRKWVKKIKEKSDYVNLIINKSIYTYKYIDDLSEPYKIFEEFMDNKLQSYFVDRNDAIIDGQSHLSAFINLGRISRYYMLGRILHKYDLSINDIFSENKNGSGTKTQSTIIELNSNTDILCNNLKIDSNLLQSIRSFVEEFVIRYELSENYCHYNQNYDNFDGLKDWAKNTLNKAKSDKREYIYNLKEFENYQTNDELWNMCQKDLIYNGRLNGYLRMFWCKKILEWSSSPEEAIKIAVYLNDKYAFDGYATPSYTGILWSIGGLHDRAWFGHNVFGNIRFMARSGVEKRMNVKKYIQNLKNIENISQGKLL